MTRRPRSGHSFAARSSGAWSADRLDHALAAAAAGRAPRPRARSSPSRRRARQRVRGADMRAQSRARTARREMRDHARAGVRGELGQQRAEEADADDRDGLARLDVAARAKMFIAQPSGSPGNGVPVERVAAASPPARPARRRTRRTRGTRGTATRSPTATRCTPSPTAATRPQPSWPGAPGALGYVNHGRPSHSGRFEPHTPQPSTRIAHLVRAGLRIGRSLRPRIRRGASITAAHASAIAQQRASETLARCRCSTQPAVRSALDARRAAPTRGRQPVARRERARVRDVVALVAGAPVLERDAAGALPRSSLDQRRAARAG